MKKIGLYGGAFDPPHIGHILALSYALAIAEVDEIWVVPCWGHAFGKHMSSFEDRLEMCRLAFQPETNSRIQIRQDERVLQTKYTIDLLRQLVKACELTPPKPGEVASSCEFTLILGEDEWRDFDRWHCASDIKKLVKIFIIGREGCNTSTSSVNFRLPDISSSEIRKRLIQQANNRKELVSGLLPDSVFSYIEKQGLFPALDL